MTNFNHVSNMVNITVKELTILVDLLDISEINPCCKHACMCI